MSKNDLFSRRIRIRFLPCAKYFWTSDNHALWIKLVFDSVGWETPSPRTKKKLLLIWNIFFGIQEKINFNYFYKIKSI